MEAALYLTFSKFSRFNWTNFLFFSDMRDFMMTLAFVEYLGEGERLEWILGMAAAEWPK